MHVVVHLDPRVLERELVERVSAAKRDDPLARILAIVPTARLAAHVRRRVVEALGAAVGVEVVTHRRLAEAIVARTGHPVPRPLLRELSDAVLARAVRRAPRGRLRTFVSERPASLGPLAGTLVDLREAGVPPEEAGRVLAGAHDELAGLYRAWTDALDALARRGRADDAAIAERALAGAPAFAASYAVVLHHGAYDLIGVHAALVEALDRGRTVVALVPDRAFAAFGATPPGSSVRASDLPALLAGKTVTFAHVQGSGPELDLAWRRSLAAVDSGVPPHEAAVLVRSFGPYAGPLEALAGGPGPPWSTSFATPLRRDRRAGALMSAAAEDPQPAARTWSGHAARIEDVRRGIFGSDDGPAARGMREILATMASVERDLGDDRRVEHEEAVAWLEASVDASAIGLGGTSGVAILDLMQARGLTFRHVALVGLNAGVFPRVGREDPFLPDDARRALREATGRPVPVPTETEGEERLLLAMACAGAADAVHVSWRRADETGRPVVPSLLLRDLARARPKTPDFDALKETARALPAHPAARLAALAGDPGLLADDEEALLAALSAGPAEACAAALASRRPEWSDAIAWVEAVESFRPHATACDGRAAAPRGGRFGVSALERLGRCPLQFFFKHVLHVPEPEEAPGPFERPSSVVGRKVHAVLRDLYARLADEGGFTGEASRARARAAALLDEIWSRSADEEDAKRAETLPLLERIDAALHLSTLRSFVGADLDRLREAGLVPVALEQDREGPVALPSGRSLVVAARFDRVAEGASRTVIGDYKTGTSLESRVDEGAMLSATQMQVPLYALLAEAEVEILGVGPVAPAPSGDDPRFVPFEGFSKPERRAGFLETVEVVAALAERGVYPMRPDRHCAWCAYRAACRRGHPASTFREERASDTSSARGVWSKKKTKPLLSDVAPKGDA